MRDITVVPSDFIITHRKTDFIEEITKVNEVRYAIERTYTELVYCKDCKWYDSFLGCRRTENFMPTNNFDFCSYGERRAE